MGLLTESSPVAGPVCTGAFTGRLWPAGAEDGGQATLTHSGVRGTDPLVGLVIFQGLCLYRGPWRDCGKNGLV